MLHSALDIGHLYSFDITFVLGRLNYAPKSQPMQVSNVHVAYVFSAHDDIVLKSMSQKGYINYLFKQSEIPTQRDANKQFTYHNFQTNQAS